MEGSRTDLPRDERLDFDAPILCESRAQSAVIQQGRAGDRVTVTGFRDGFAQIGLGWRAGYVRQDAVGVPVHLGMIRPAHNGALLVATGLTLFAWITLVLSQISGMLAAANYSCADSFAGSTCGDESAARLIVYLVLAVPGLFMALLMWAGGYGLLLLTSVEVNTRFIVSQTE